VVEEIFVVVDSRSEARFVDRLNNEEARITRRRRFKALAEAGRLHEAQMPDSYEVIVGQVRTNQWRRETEEYAKRKLREKAAGFVADVYAGNQTGEQFDVINNG